MNNYEGFALEHLMGAESDLPDWVCTVLSCPPTRSRWRPPRSLRRLFLAVFLFSLSFLHKVQFCKCPNAARTLSLGASDLPSGLMNGAVCSAPSGSVSRYEP